VFQLKNKVAIVTGGNGGIGLGMARGLALAGARVVVAARNIEKSAAAVAELRRLGSDSVAMSVDVREDASVKALVAGTLERCGRVDILVNNAGTNVRKAPQELAIEEWRLVIDTNLTGAFLCSRAVHEPMRRAGGGKIINIGSMFSIFGAGFAAAYGASKGGVVQLTRSLAVAWAADNVQVNAVLPGFIDTDLSREARRQIPGLHDRATARTPAGRWGTADDVAGIAVFLAAAASDFITGAVIPVDGGYSILG
jgi:2-deoxy-D-gluconate 3-dehydrogenase